LFTFCNEWAGADSLLFAGEVDDDADASFQVMSFRADADFAVIDLVFGTKEIDDCDDVDIRDSSLCLILDGDEDTDDVVDDDVDNNNDVGVSDLLNLSCFDRVSRVDNAATPLVISDLFLDPE
jgi:hypothetical protein